MATSGRVAATHASASWRARARALGDSPPIRYFKTHQDLAAALLLALLVIAYLWPALIGLKILSPLSMLYTSAPWQGYAPTDIADYFNPLLSDIAMADYPWRWYTRNALHAGELPLWNPQVFGGIPFMSNPQIGLYTPFNLPLWILPLNYALGLSAAIKLWFGGFGAYLLSRQLRLGFLPGLLAGVAYAFCSMNITWLTHETLPAVAVLLPWMVLLTERIFAAGRAGTMLWLAVATAAGLGGGHPGMQVHLMAAAGLYAVVRVWLVPELERREQLRRLALVGGGLVLGAALIAVMLLPEMLASRGTIGVAARNASSSTMPGSILPKDALKTIAFPDWWGRPSSATVPGSSDTSAGSLVNYNERTFYGGVVALLFGLIAVVSRGGWRAKSPFALLAVIGLAAPAHLPGLWQLLTNVPPFDLVQNQRLHFVYEFGIAILAAFGLRALLDQPRGARLRLLVPAAGLAVGIAALLSIGAGGRDISDTWEHFASGTTFVVSEVLALTSTVWFLLFVLGVGAALLAAARWPRARYWIATGVVLLAVLDALHFAIGYQPMGPADKVIPPETPAIAYLKEHKDDGRIIGLGAALPNDWSITYGLHDVRGYDPPNPTQRYFDLWRIANPGQADWTPFGIGAVNAESLQVMNVLGARYLVSDPGLTLPPGLGRDPVLGSLRIVHAGEDATVIENSTAVPRTLLPSRFVIAGDGLEARALIARPDFRPLTTVVVERDAADAAALADAPAARGSVRIVGDENQRVTLRARLDRRGLVVLNDTYAKGWTVTVDGRAASPVLVNSVMRGVVAGPGQHEIVWSYSMPGLTAGALISLLALLGISGGAVLLRIHTRRTTRGT